MCNAKVGRCHTQGCTSMLDDGQRPIKFAKCLFDFSVERTNVTLPSCLHSKHPVIYYFGHSQTSHSLAYDWLFALHLSLHLTDKYSHSRLFSDSFTQRLPLAHCVPSASLDGFPNGGYKYC